MRTGIDIVHIKRFAKMYSTKTGLDKIFTDYEISYIGKVSSGLSRMAGLYAAKEAVLKALGIGIYGGIALTQIQIQHEDNGRPYIVLTDKLLGYMKDVGVHSLDISISHTDTDAIAICIME